MKPEDELLILSHTQFVARFYGGLKTSADKVVELIRHSIGASAPPADAIKIFLRREETKDRLATAYETGIWESADRAKSWRLVTLAVPTDLETCKHKLNANPPSRDCCNWCWLEERGHDREIMLPELDAYRNPVPNVQLHRACSRPWRVMRNISERSK